MGTGVEASYLTSIYAESTSYATPCPSACHSLHRVEWTRHTAYTLSGAACARKSAPTRPRARRFQPAKNSPAFLSGIGGDRACGRAIGFRGLPMATPIVRLGGGPRPGHALRGYQKSHRVDATGLGHRSKNLVRKIRTRPTALRPHGDGVGNQSGSLGHLFSPYLKRSDEGPVTGPRPMSIVARDGSTHYPVF